MKIKGILKGQVLWAPFVLSFLKTQQIRVQSSRHCVGQHRCELIKGKPLDWARANGEVEAFGEGKDWKLGGGLGCINKAVSQGYTWIHAVSKIYHSQCWRKSQAFFRVPSWNTAACRVSMNVNHQKHSKGNGQRVHSCQNWIIWQYYKYSLNVC